MTRPEHIPERDWETALGYVRQRARHFARQQARKHWLDTGSFLGCAWEGFAKAGQRWEPGRGVRFSGYAANWINGEILEEIRRQGRQARGLSRLQVSRLVALQEAGEPIPAAWLPPLGLDDLLPGQGAAEPEPLTWADTLAAPDDTEQEAEWRRLARLLPQLIPPWERRLLLAHHVDGRTHADLGREWGLSESRIGQILGESAQRLRERAAKARWMSG